MRTSQAQVLGLLLVKRSAGHSKWANIKHDKAIIDQKRANVFSRLSRQIRIAIQEGGGSTNPVLNSYLKTVIDQATKLNMPMATINNQIKKFNPSDVQMRRYFLEIKSIGRLFLICEVCTDNIAGLKQFMYTVMRKAGQTTFGDVKHFFEEMGTVHVTKSDGNYKDAEDFENQLTEHALECDAQEVEVVDFNSKSAVFICKPMELERIKRSLLSMGYSVESADHIFVPVNSYKLTEAEKKTYDYLHKKLLELDGVENLYSNADFDET